MSFLEAELQGVSYQDLKAQKAVLLATQEDWFRGFGPKGCQDPL